MRGNVIRTNCVSQIVAYAESELTYCQGTLHTYKDDKPTHIYVLRIVRYITQCVFLLSRLKINHMKELKMCIYIFLGLLA
jgi:hypothetical protein